MSNRVLSTDQAANTITQMKTLLNGDLTANLQTLIAHGNTLADPTVWDGDLAVKHRGSWPTTSQQLNTTLKNLQELHHALETIHQNIFTAGGNA